MNSTVEAIRVVEKSLNYDKMAALINANYIRYIYASAFHDIQGSANEANKALCVAMALGSLLDCHTAKNDVEMAKAEIKNDMAIEYDVQQQMRTRIKNIKKEMYC